jgi:thermostable 8-oxoguanine DNA glycosylase
VVDPEKITKFDSTDSELQEVLLFWILAAGKNARTSAAGLQRFLDHGRDVFGPVDPFTVVKRFGSELPSVLRSHGLGCYNNKAESMLDLASKNMDLKKCTLQNLENIKGIGPKTARCFLVHSRPGCRYACIDTHVLKYMREKGYEVPKSTPSGKRYLEIERNFLGLVDESGKTVAEFDLEIWNKYSKAKRKKMKT